MSNKKRILYIVEAMGGGVFTYIVDLANALVEEYDMYIAYATRRQTPADYQQYFDKRIHLIKVINFKRSINPAQDVKALFEIKKIAAEVKPDVIHLHSSKAGVLGRLAFNGHKIPLFYTPHGYSFLMRNHNAINRMFYRMIEGICGKYCCTTISCSEGEYREALKLTRRAVYVNNGINLEKLQQLVENIPMGKEHPFTVFTLGRICYQKGPVRFNEIAKAFPDIRFIWIGDGELRAELSASNIEITGWVDRKTALKYALQSDVFLLTSLWEGLPMSLLESMYLRKLCVVSDVIGNQDVIHTGDNGFVCNHLEDYVEAIQTAQRGQVQQLIDNAFLDVEEKYNTVVMENLYSGIYQRALIRE